MTTKEMKRQVLNTGLLQLCDNLELAANKCCTTLYVSTITQEEKEKAIQEYISEQEKYLETAKWVCEVGKDLGETESWNKVVDSLQKGLDYTKLVLEYVQGKTDKFPEYTEEEFGAMQHQFLSYLGVVQFN